MRQSSCATVQAGLRLAVTLALAALWVAPWRTADRAQAAEPPPAAKLTLAIFGDSITRATIADKQLGQIGTVDDTRNFARFGEIAPLFPYSPDNTGLLNYQLMSAFDFVMRDPLGAVQGNQPYSLAVRLQAATGREVDVIKAAHLGGTFRESDPQLAVFADALRQRGLTDADLVFVDLGRGDFSLYPDIATFTADVDRFMSRLFQISPHARVIINRIPNEIQPLNRPDRVALRIPDDGDKAPDGSGNGGNPKFKDLSCSFMLGSTISLTNTGLNVGRDNTKNLAAATARYEALNTVLMQTVARYRAAGARIAMVDILPDRKNPDDWDKIFAYDCVHINTTGQQEIADHLYPVAVQLLALPAAAPVLPAATAPADDRFLSDTGMAIWMEYQASLGAQHLQPGCRPQFRHPAVGTQYRGVAFLVHGFSACPDQMNELADRLTAEGYAVVQPLLPGHGLVAAATPAGQQPVDDLSALPSPRLTDDGNFRTAYNGLTEWINLLAPEFRGEHLIAGVSLGAAVATAVTKLHPGIWDRQLLLSPFYELSDDFQELTFGFIATLGRIDAKWWATFDPILNQRIGWGDDCRRDRAAGRFGYCSFTIAQALGAAEFGFETWQLVQPMTVQTQIVAVQEDDRVSARPIFTAAGIMRNEVLGKDAYQTAERFDQHPYVRVCYMPSHRSVCASNATQPLGQQGKPCVSHTLIASHDDVGLDHYWQTDLIGELAAFLTSGEPLPQVTDDRYAADPYCAGFSRG